MGFLIASSGRWRSHTRRAGYGQRSLRPKDSPLGSATKRRSTCAREDRPMIWTNGHTVTLPKITQHADIQDDEYRSLGDHGTEPVIRHSAS